jgi:hypothetical protein
VAIGAWAAGQLGHDLRLFLTTYSRWIPSADGRVQIGKVDSFNAARQQSPKASAKSSRAASKAPMKVPKQTFKRNPKATYDDLPEPARGAVSPRCPRGALLPMSDWCPRQESNQSVVALTTNFEIG